MCLTARSTSKSFVVYFVAANHINSGASSRDRTGTPVSEASDFKSGVSTNSTILAKNKTTNIALEDSLINLVAITVC